MKVINKANLQSNQSSSRHHHPFLQFDTHGSEILSHYFSKKKIPLQEDQASPLPQINLQNMSKEEILARIDKINSKTVGRINKKDLFEQAPQWAKDIIKFIMEKEQGGEDIEVASEEYQEKKKESRGAPSERDLSNMKVVFD